MPRSLPGVWLAVCLATVPPAAVPAPSDLERQFDLMAIHGDLSEADALFNSVPPSEMTAGERILAAAYSDRFHGPSRAVPPKPDLDFARAVAEVYRGYWRSALRESGGEAMLRSGLLRLLERETSKAVDQKQLFFELRTALDRHGIRYDERPGPPLRDLLIWREERRARYTVQLTDRVMHLAVRFVDGIELKGWKDYASLGRLSTTGWVHDGELYCIANAYELSSETFRVSFLKHEARHLADLEQFPGLEAGELEYRAKLTELVFALRTTQELLNDFSGKSSRAGTAPHARANRRVVQDVYRELNEREMPPAFSRWADFDNAAVSRAARRLLERHSGQLRAGTFNPVAADRIMTGN